MAASPVLYVYYPPLNDDSYPGVPNRHITEADWARFSLSQRRTVENATTQEGYTRRKVWVHRDLVDETEQERADREAAEQAARDAYERGQSIVRWREFEKVVPGPGEVIVGSADGPVARSLSEIGGDPAWVNVRDHGATGDGVTNDTTAFHAAIAALGSSGGTVYVPNGVYVVAVRVKTPNVRILGQSWDAILKTQDNSTVLDTDCPLRLLADNGVVENIAIDGNPSGNTHLNTLQLARSADGIGIYASHCRVSGVKTDGNLGHHIIVWNDSFPPEGIPVGSRQHTVVENCLSVNSGRRNTYDFASTEGVGIGEGYDQNINRFNVFRNNTVIGGQIVIHTGWDTIVEGNIVTDDGSGTRGYIGIHTASRRVTVRNNTVERHIVGQGGLTGAEETTERRSRDITIEGNTILSMTTDRSYGINVRQVDGFAIRGNHVFDVSAGGITYSGVTNGVIEGNRVVGSVASGYGVQDIAGSNENDRSVGLTITANRVSGVTTPVLLMRTSDAALSGNTLHGTGAVVDARAECGPVRIARNTLTTTSGLTSGAVRLASANARLEGNTVVTNGAGVVVTGADTVIVDNEITANGGSGIRSSAPRTIVRRNRVKATSDAILLEAASEDDDLDSNVVSTTGARGVRVHAPRASLTANRFTGTAMGIGLEATAIGSLVVGNVATGAGQGGLVGSPSGMIAKNNVLNGVFVADGAA